MKKKNGRIVYNVPPYGYVRINNNKTISFRDYKGHWSKTLLSDPSKAIQLLKDKYHKEVKIPVRVKDNRPMGIRILNYVMYVDKIRRERASAKKTTYFWDGNAKEKTKALKAYEQIPNHINALIEE